MKILELKDFMRKINLKNYTMNKSRLQRLFDYSMYLRDSKVYSDRGSRYHLEIHCLYL